MNFKSFSWLIIQYLNYPIFILNVLGDVADGMYFIEDGKISIQISQDGGEVEISQLGTGQYFGELALVTHRPRAASAYALENCKVACKYITNCFMLCSILVTCLVRTFSLILYKIKCILWEYSTY